MSGKHDVGWAAGFFEGEGTVGFNRTSNNEKYRRLAVNVTQIHREPLDKFQEIAGVGKVRGPYGPYAGNRKPHYQFNASGEEGLHVLNLLMPYLFAKGEQARDAILKYEDYYSE